jgi:hypothetical protein
MFWYVICYVLRDFIKMPYFSRFVIRAFLLGRFGTRVRKLVVDCTSGIGDDGLRFDPVVSQMVGR